MGKKRRLNKLISKWIKSDLPDDRSSVLLLKVTRSTASPKPSRRPFSLPLGLGVVSNCSRGSQVRRNSSSVSSGRLPSVARRDSRHGAAKGERLGARPLTQPHDITKPEETNTQSENNCQSSTNKVKSTEKDFINVIVGEENHFEGVSGCRSSSPVLSLCIITVTKPENVTHTTVEPTSCIFPKIDKERGITEHIIPTVCISGPGLLPIYTNSCNGDVPSDHASSPNTLKCSLSPVENVDAALMMETSVDSIGTCSLDMEASADLSDWSEVSSTGTLRSANIPTPVDQQQHHLPSYLSLACTVNGYSTTTNYDPGRLARSRDASPHRIDPSHLTGNQASYSVTNNLLSPPNLVPLPTPKPIMTENVLRHHQEFYSSSKTMTFLSKESHFTTNIFTKDSADGCLDNTHHTIQRKCVQYESKNFTSLHDKSKCTHETVVNKEYTNGKETKSFIQQRVERLYGPGALAQGFFVSKRQKNRLSECEEPSTISDHDKLNKTLPEKLSDEENIEPIMKQSSSSPALPVLRHLRPEFRAQLPIINPRKNAESFMQKSITVPKLKDEVKVNGHAKVNEEIVSESVVNHKQNGNVAQPSIDEESSEKDGHYFIKILEEQTSRLLELADETESNLATPGLTEEVIGIIRSAAGKARLLVSQKMQQFKGLCTNNITQTAGEAFPTTNEDLQGFWDMVMLQVDQVDKLFEEINMLRANNWKVEIVKPGQTKTNGTTKLRKVVSKPKTSAVNEEARKQREEQRKKMIEERRKAMKAQQAPNPSIEIFVPETS